MGRDFIHLVHCFFPASRIFVQGMTEVRLYILIINISVSIISAGPFCSQPNYLPIEPIKNTFNMARLYILLFDETLKVCICLLFGLKHSLEWQDWRWHQRSWIWEALVLFLEMCNWTTQLAFLHLIFLIYYIGPIEIITFLLTSQECCEIQVN